VTSRDRSVMRVQVAGHRAHLDVAFVDRSPARWRMRLALWLIRMAGRVARLRVRVVRH
jgi:hypothetical protein